MSNDTEYDSTQDTLEHKKTVRANLNKVLAEIIHRQIHHDDSKLQEPEKSIFDRFTPKLRDSTYGSEEYKSLLSVMEVALQHHYQENSHHPEHYLSGISGMSLLDVIEMLADWKAATLRHADGDMQKSLEINKERFQISEQLFSILQNTVRELGW